MTRKNDKMKGKHGRNSKTKMRHALGDKDLAKVSGGRDAAASGRVSRAAVDMLGLAIDSKKGSPQEAFFLGAVNGLVSPPPK